MKVFFAVPGAASAAIPGLKEMQEELAGVDFELAFLDPTRPLVEQLGDVDVIIPAVTDITEDVIKAAPNLKLIIQYGVGLDTVDIPAATARNVYVANIPGTSAISQAEHALMLMLTLVKQFPQSQENLRNGIFFSPVGTELGGKTLGIIGFGRSGRSLAIRAKPLEMKVIVCEKFHDTITDADVDFLGGVEDLDYVLENSDFVSLHTDLNESTRDMINAERLRKMKKTAFLINVARAAIVVKEDLIAALEGGVIAGAGLDVFWEEPCDPNDKLFSCPNLIATPHIATATIECRLRTGGEVGRSIAQVAGGSKPEDCVNL